METTQASDVKARELNELCKELAAQEEHCEKLKAELVEQNKKYAALEARGVEYLEALGQDFYEGPFGRISFKNTWRVNLPDSPENLQKLLGYFQARGMFEGMVTVNSNKLNSFYKEEQEIAEAEGRGMEFEIPGLNPPKLYRKPTFKQKGTK